jgi:hypothetical protein
MEQTERINRMRNSVIENMGRVMHNAIQEVKTKGYLVTTIAFEDSPDKQYLIIDFTSKQIEHLHDLEEYSKKIYRNFMGKPTSC